MKTFKKIVVATGASCPYRADPFAPATSRLAARPVRNPPVARHKPSGLFRKVVLWIVSFREVCMKGIVECAVVGA